MSSWFSIAARWWRWAHVRRNSLVRRWDRIESGALLVLVLVVLAAAPPAAVLGSEMYARQSELAPGALPDGRPRTGVVLADRGLRAGAPVSSWLGVIAGCAGVFLLARWFADRARAAGWEWARLGVRS